MSRPLIYYDDLETDDTPKGERIKAAVRERTRLIATNPPPAIPRDLVTKAMMGELPAPEPRPFEVGDRVRWKAVGHIGTLSSMCGPESPFTGEWRWHTDAGSKYITEASALELIEPAAQAGEQMAEAPDTGRIESGIVCSAAMDAAEACTCPPGRPQSDCYLHGWLEGSRLWGRAVYSQDCEPFWEDDDGVEAIPSSTLDDSLAALQRPEPVPRKHGMTMAESQRVAHRPSRLDGSR